MHRNNDPASMKTATSLFTAKDSPEMRNAIRVLTSAGLRVRRPSPYQLKIGSLNYYPGKRTIYRDNCARMSETGLDAFVRIALLDQGRSFKTNTRAPFELEGAGCDDKTTVDDCYAIE